MGEEMIDYLRRVDATLPPFQGRFISHGKTPEVVEGEWVGSVVIIEFPDLERARGWYHSPAYQEILPLRTDNADSSAILLDGVGADYRAVHFLESIGLG